MVRTSLWFCVCSGALIFQVGGCSDSSAPADLADSAIVNSESGADSSTPPDSAGSEASTSPFRWNAIEVIASGPALSLAFNNTSILARLPTQECARRMVWATPSLWTSRQGGGVGMVKYPRSPASAKARASKSRSPPGTSTSCRVGRGQSAVVARSVDGKWEQRLRCLTSAKKFRSLFHVATVGGSLGPRSHGQKTARL